jgi:hypothetical protein
MAFTRKAIQLKEVFATSAEALQRLGAMKAQEGFIGGRTYQTVGGGWACQTFHTDETDGECWLPDGMKRVLIPDGPSASFGILA